MSKCHLEEITCPHCYEEFEITIYDSINVTLDPELREKVFDGSIFRFTCPHCGKVVQRPYEFLYHDMENKFMIFLGRLSTAMKNYQFIKNDEFLGFIEKDYVNSAVDAPRDLIERIILLENGFDYRIAEIYKKQFIKTMDEDYPSLGVLYARFSLKKDEVIINGFDDNDDNVCYFSIDMKAYHAIYDEYISKVDEFFTYFLTSETINRIIRNIENKEDYLNKKMKVAVVSDRNGVEFFANILPHNIKTYDVGDAVLLSAPDGRTAIGYIETIFETNAYISPTDYENEIEILSKHHSFHNFTATNDSETELDNKELLELLISFKKKEGQFPYSLAFESEAILGFEATFEFDNKNPDESYEVGDIINPSQVKTKLNKLELDNKTYLCVYLSQDDIKEKTTSKIVTNLNDIFEFVLFNTRYDGVVINPNKEEIIVTESFINKRYIPYRHMVDANNMRELLTKLDEEDISYIGEETFKFIWNRYFGDVSMEEEAEKLGIEVEYIEKRLDEGYNRMIELLRSKYILNEKL